MKRVSIIAILACLLMVPVVVNAADMGERDKFVFGEANWISETEFTVSISVTQDERIVAMDIPLEWSKGVTLTEVSFTDTRVDYFDVKIANIDEENNKVLIGLISMVYGPKDALECGNGVIAELTFRRDDVTLEEFEINPFEATNPGHKLSFVYNIWTDGKPVVDHAYPEVEGNTISLNGALDRDDPLSPLPTVYDLGQNYPNPFNPSTTIAYSIKSPGNVKLNIYNVLGQEVRTLINEYQDAGNYSAYWDGMDNNRGTVSSGVYFYRIQSGDFNVIKKMVLMK